MQSDKPVAIQKGRSMDIRDIRCLQPALALVLDTNELKNVPAIKSFARAQGQSSRVDDSVDLSN